MGRIRGPRSKRRRELIARLAERHGWNCRWCQRPLSYDGPEHLRPTLDHIIPLSAGGSNQQRNLAIACFRCNHRKGDAHPAARVTSHLRRGVEHDGSLKS